MFICWRNSDTLKCSIKSSHFITFNTFVSLNVNALQTVFGFLLLVYPGYLTGRRRHSYNQQWAADDAAAAAVA